MSGDVSGGGTGPGPRHPKWVRAPSVAKAILGTVCGGLADDLPKSAAGLGNLCRTDVAEHVQHPDKAGALGPEYAPTVLNDEHDSSVLSRQQRPFPTAGARRRARTWASVRAGRYPPQAWARLTPTGRCCRPRRPRWVAGTDRQSVERSANDMLTSSFGPRGRPTRSPGS
jgi:hypothetical protein